jgi:LDH2 family malate/lactate/ureidoglycolate dehydrogenase
LDRYAVEHLRHFAREVFRRHDVPEDDATLAAEVLTEADLRGIESHGVLRLGAYLDMLSSGRVKARPEITVVGETFSTACVDGDNGLGLVVGPRANDIAIKKASVTGCAWVSVRNSNHFGIAAYYSLQALRHDLIGLVMTNTPPQVAPAGGAERRLGTNPISIAFPGETEPPIVIDMSTSAISFGKLEQAHRSGSEVPLGCGIDRDGRTATRAEAILGGGALLPLGSTEELGSHKGYCLAAMIDLLCGVLGGASWGPFVPSFPLDGHTPERNVGLGIGHLFLALRIDAVTDPGSFKRRVDEWIHVMRSTVPASPQVAVAIPGDAENNAGHQRRTSGIPLPPSVVADLRKIGTVTGIPFD